MFRDVTPTIFFFSLLLTLLQGFNRKRLLRNLLNPALDVICAPMLRNHFHYLFLCFMSYFGSGRSDIPFVVVIISNYSP